MQPDRDAYAVLGIPPSASMWAIHKTYLGLRLRYHFGESRHTGITSFHEIEAAYQALATPKRRTAYERSRFAPETPAPAPTGRARHRPALRALGYAGGVMIGGLLGWLVGAGIGVLSGEWVDAAPGLQVALAIAVSLMVVTIGPDVLTGGVGHSELITLLMNVDRVPPTTLDDIQVVGWGAAVGGSIAGVLAATRLLVGWAVIAAAGVGLAGGCILGIAAVRFLRGLSAKRRGAAAQDAARYLLIYLKTGSGAVFVSKKTYASVDDIIAEYGNGYATSVQISMQGMLDFVESTCGFDESRMQRVRDELEAFERSGDLVIEAPWLTILREDDAQLDA